LSDGVLYLEGPGLWVQILAAGDAGRVSPALFVDRDGTLIADTGYPRRASDVSLIPEVLPALRAANAAGVPVVIASNQSGIARGLLGWPDFAAVNARMLDLLAAADCSVAAVLACGYYRSADRELDFEDHPMRKPNPGMLHLAAERISLDLGRSIIIGDKASDLAAGSRAGLDRGFLVGNAEATQVATSFRSSRISGPGDWANLVAAVTACGRPL
jgi:D-glycero-D-manno-heptose 1,7-bisphosphate phosphatase